MNRKTLLATSIKSALIASIAATTTLSINANADESANNVERIAVTGSRIQRQDMETASPVTVLDAAAISEEGFTSVDQLLQAQTSMAGNAIGSASNNGAQGVAQVDLRGMGAQRTLVLLNGRRMVNSGAGADSAVDLNSIPVAMIARVEILKDGASAVYGSDAIAGVVNIITKKDFDGLQLDVKGGASDKGDGENGEISGLYGVDTDSGNYTFGLAYSRRDEVIQSDRDWTEPGQSSFIPSGSFGGKVQDASGHWVDRNTSYDYTTTSYYQTPSKRYSAFANMTQDIGEDMTLTGDMIYTKRKSGQQLAPEPVDLMLNVCDPKNTPSAGCMDLTPAMVAGGIQADDTGRVNYRRRMSDVGPRGYSQDTDTLRLSTALAGSIDVNNGMDWDISYTYGYNKAHTNVANSINATKLSASVYANTDQWMSGQSLDAATLQDVSYYEQAEGGNEQHTVSASLTGDLFDVSAGSVGFSIGAEYRHDSGYQTPDQVVINGDSSSAQQAPTKGSYSVVSVFEEVSVPFTEKLNGDFALRYDDYSTFGHAATWKIGLTYEATDDLMLRTVAATGFRAPSVSELYGGNTGSYEYLSDPAGVAKDPQILDNWTSDEHLQPEKSESYTAGLVYSPSFVDGLSLTLDYWRFKVEDSISRIDTQDYMNRCYAGDTGACDTINITADNAQKGDWTGLTNQLTNVGAEDTSGLDFNLNYHFEAFNLDWKVNNDTTYLIEHETDNTDYAGTIDGNFGAYARVRNNFKVQAGAGDWTVAYTNRLIGAMNEPAAVDYVGYNNSTSAALYHNVVGTYDLTDAMTLTLGVKNFTDKTPERVVSGSDGGTSPDIFDPVGRQYYAGFSMKL
ncbi:TonB-dependent receptor [Shewanella intestini]|uniref:TonB-dependent receptor n=1 Tax=Shewanella intestini TaxID=2017544 RepID=A0ABS5I581_9GAMM|nr:MULTISPECIES: TonB-dependent receptor [Shewanella]MBR9728988.1 TonB-dependent receptor [Shewanella intestini]MRG36946.1 TonB-dependent receptor [Shewanella sp. XMDDZSB0408]